MKYKVTLNNRVYEVEVEQGEAMLVNEYELGSSRCRSTCRSACCSSPCRGSRSRTGSRRARRGEVITSPMPGNILKINITQGQKVNEGDVLIVLEAMKM